MSEKYLGKKVIYVLAKNEQDFKKFCSFLPLMPAPLGSIGVAYTKTHNYRFVTDARMLEGYNIDLSRAELRVTEGANERADFDHIVSLFTESVGDIKR